MSKILLRASAATVALVLLTSAGAAVAAAADDTDGVDVNVDIQPLTEPGTLALTVAADSTTLTENGSTDTVRQFTGVLPTVTVTDTRSAEEIPDGANWYVLGAADDFAAAGGSAITADHFGWSPRFVGGDDEGDGVVSIGGDVQTVLDGDRGLVGEELFYLGEDLPAVEGGGAWSATADLFLRVPRDVTPGQYTSTVTLSLFQ